MNKDFLQAEVAALLRHSALSKPDSAMVLDAALNDVFSTQTHKACCPFCETIFMVPEATIDYFVRCECPKCHQYSIVATGTIVSKRSNTSLMSINGLFIRFRDAAKRERYIELYRAFANPELKSKDAFSLCVGQLPPKNDALGNSFDPSRGLFSVMNLTINNAPKLGRVDKRELVLAALQGPAT